MTKSQHSVEASQIEVAIETYLKLKGVRCAYGPSMSCFYQPGVETAEPIKTDYSCFEILAPFSNSLLAQSVANVAVWLIPGNDLVLWRDRPYVQQEDGKWEVSFRCGQTKKFGDFLPIMWPV